MGWWRRGDGVIGDPAADYMESLKNNLGGITWKPPSEIPGEIRERIAQFYWQELGRGPTEEDLRELLEFMNVGE